MNAPTPICLPRVGNYKKIFTGLNVTVAGWGKAHEKAGASTRKLQKLEGMPILDFEKCVEMTPKFKLTDRMLCAGFVEGGRDACTGDSGGPLVYQEAPNRYRQIGVVSFGAGCARRKSPGIYSKLTDLSQWVIYHTSQVNPYWCRDTYSSGDS
ncbi:plasma kallikrein-like [Folsomia candida]|nr:plasma kallikrein-like [Folsomia candida]